jgi:hypothetical protein
VVERDPTDLLLAPGMFGAPGDKPPLRLHPIERELHSISSAVGRVANALESISKDVAAIRKLAEHERR